MALVFGLIAAAFALLQSTWLSGWNIAGARPDFVLAVITYAAHVQGAQRGQVTGFVVGAFEDVLSLSPLGFHAVIRLASGAVMGRTHGSVRGDAIVMPALLLVVATLIQKAATLLVSLILGMGEIADVIFSLSLFVEVGLNALIGPLAFFALTPVRRRFSRRGGFS